MATLNVFELTNEEFNKARTVKESKTPKKSSKVVKESKRIGKFKKVERLAKKRIPSNKIHLESLRFVEEAEENDEVIDYTPEEDVVLVIDPEMDETPETEADAEEAAEELIGDFVCKCAVCGANYVCDCEDVSEDLESEEGECPVCGETGEQIVVGEITPAEDVVTDEDEDEEVASDEEDFEDDVTDDDFIADDDFDEDEVVVDDEPIEDEEDEYEESISRAKRRTALRRENAMKANRRRSVESRVAPKKARKVTESKDYNLDEVTLNRMLTQFAKENYDNVRFVKITKGSCKGTKLTLEGTIVTKNNSKRSTKFVCENFRPSATMTSKFTEVGAFTENAITRGPAFTIDFRTRNNVITPVALKYSYKVKESAGKFLVSGKVMNESFKKRTK